MADTRNMKSGRGRKAPAAAPPRVRPAAAVPAGAPATRWARALRDHRGLIVPIGFVLLMSVVLVPVPPVAMDLLISANISLSVIILLTTIYMTKPLDFSVFPSLLLATTLLRLVLNIASTRLILSAEASTPEEAVHSAGHVISAFGTFVAGDSLFVGVVIFLILVVVQFVVVTKGATRISEVAARFILDAMPGKQMAIDSDLNAGAIDEGEARRRREEIRQEADFFGAMDGASKFVRGDAIAGIIITVINVLGGFGVGIISKGWDAARTAEVYTTLTIGDGLTAQIPAFVVSVAAALIVTRSGARADLGDELTGQLASQPRGLAITAGFLAVLAFTGLPMIPLLATGAGLGGLAWSMSRATRRRAEAMRREAEAPKPAEGPPVESLLKVDVLELEVGYGLVALVDPARGGDLLERVAAVRRQIAAELGLVMPPVRIRDNVQLGANDYRLKVRGTTIAKGQTRPGRLLAMDSGAATGKLTGEPTREAAFGLSAWWIDPALKPRAESMNYTVVDATSVVATHLSELVKRHAAELLTREEVNNLVATLKERAPKLVEEAVPALVKPAELHKILQNLLRERVPVRDLESILETLADWAPKTKDPEILTEYVRNTLRRTICAQHAAATDRGQKLVCVTLDPALEETVASYIDRGPSGTTVSMPPRVASEVAGAVARGLQPVIAAGHAPVVIASPTVRSVVRQIVEPHLPGLVVLGYNEIDPAVEVESMGLVARPAESARAPAGRDTPGRDPVAA